MDRLRQEESLRRGETPFFEPVAGLAPELEPRNGHSPESVSGAAPNGAAPNGAGAMSGGAVAPGTLGSRVAKGMSLSLGVTLFMQIISIARTVGLARALTQSDFGVAAMGLTVMGALYTLTNTGVVASVVSGRFDSDEELARYSHLVWTLEIARGTLIALSLVLMAWPFARFYHEPRLTLVIAALALTPIFTSLQNVGLALKSRGVEVGALSVYNVATTSITVVGTLALAFTLHSYWALVWGGVLGAAAGTAASYVISDFRPRLLWDKLLWERAWTFGRHLFVGGLASYVITMMDNVAVGYFLGGKILGVYVVAYTFCTLARTVVNNAFNTVLFPAFAAAGREDDPERLRGLVERTFSLGIVALTALVTPMWIFAPAIVRVFYRLKWAAAVEPMRFLLIAGFFAGLGSLFWAFFVGLDRSEFESKGRLLDAGVFLVALLPLTHAFGMVGAALTGCLTWSAACVWRWVWASRLTPGAFNRLPLRVALALGTGAGAAILWGVARALLGAGHAVSRASFGRALSPKLPSLGEAWLHLLVAAPLISLLCVAVLALFNPSLIGELRSIKGKLFARASRA